MLRPLVVLFCVATCASCSDDPAQLTDGGGPAVDGSADAGPSLPDAGPDASLPDAAPDSAPAAPTLTWAGCHSLALANTLTTAQKASCDAHYLTASASRRFRIRFVAVNVTKADWKAWIDARVKETNRVFAKSRVSFEAQSAFVVAGIKYEDATDTKQYTFREIAADVAKLIESKETAADKILAALKDRLRKTWVPEGALRGITLDSKRRSGSWWGVVARSYESIHIFVTTKFPAAGVSSLAGQRLLTAATGIIRLKPGVGVSVLPHELGHYLGLPHTHQGRDPLTKVEDTLNYASKTKKTASYDPLALLRGRLGADLKTKLTLPYLRYSATNAARNTFLSLRRALGALWIWPRLTYRKGLLPFSGLADLVSAGSKTEVIYVKNMRRAKAASGQTWSGNNCTHSRTPDRVDCRFGDPAKIVQGSQPLIDGAIAFDKGKVANVMSYITVRASSNRKSGLTPEQIDIIDASAFSPSRAFLRDRGPAPKSAFPEVPPPPVDGIDDEAGCGWTPSADD